MSAHKEDGQKWLDGLPQVIQRLSEKWHLSDIVEFENLSWNFVAACTHFSEKRVLKISYDLPSLRKEVSALRTFTLGSAVDVIDFDESHNAVLLEAADPGTELLRVEGKGNQSILEICCDVALNIRHKQQSNAFPFDGINNQFQNLDKDWPIPGHFLTLAKQFKKELMNFESDQYLIHGDLHRGNILAHQSGWKVIDPKGFLGNLYNEVWPFIHEPEIELPWVAKRLNLDETLLTKWCFIHSILSATWGIEDGIDPTNVLSLTKKIYALLN